MSESKRKIERGKKRKRRSQMQMVKKLARKRDYGGELDQETYQYMVKVFELLKEGFPSTEEKEIFVNNVFEQTRDREVEYAKNQLGSRLLETLLVYAPLETIRRLVDAFDKSLRPLSSDRFASHVLQKIIVICADRGNRSASSGSKSETNENTDLVVGIKEFQGESYNNIVLKLCKYFINNMEEFVFDTYANHLIRTAIECLGGLIDRPDDSRRKNSNWQSIRERRPVVREYKDLLVQACNRLLKWPRFSEFGHDELTSGLIQSILYSLQSVDDDLVELYIGKITKESFKAQEHEKISSTFEKQSLARLLETCLAVSSAKSFECMYKRFFAGNLEELSTSKETNFSIQRLVDHCKTVECYEKIFEELSDCPLQDILTRGYTGIFVSIANACKRLETKQGPCINIVMKLFHCEGSSEKQFKIVPCVSALKRLEELENLEGNGTTEDIFVHLHGSLIVQAMLRFKKPIKIVNSILEMEAERLLRVLANPKGSRILDAFMDSEYIGEKSKEKLARRLGGWWAQLASSSHGSRCLERMWQWAPMKEKIRIMDELTAAGESLRSTVFGKIVSKKLNVPLFARDSKQWMESLGKEEKTRSLFADIIGREKHLNEKK